jgi:hypothetical protein
MAVSQGAPVSGPDHSPTAVHMVSFRASRVGDAGKQAS